MKRRRGKERKGKGREGEGKKIRKEERKKRIKKSREQAKGRREEKEHNYLLIFIKFWQYDHQCDNI